MESWADPVAVTGMARFGIASKNTYGVSVQNLRGMAKKIGKDHLLAQKLWSSGIHEGIILASMIDLPEKVTEEQMESWVKDIDSWDICDQCCSNLFSRTRFPYVKAAEWSRRNEEFVKRSSFSLMAALAVHEREVCNERFVGFLETIVRESSDERNFVKKAVNWALLQIGKRNLELNKKAIEASEHIAKKNSRGAKWIASDAYRELTSEYVQKRLHAREEMKAQF
ncbi:DNA alkylation repair protein [Candidatus Bathyarchaeota archaeon]|nr:DNA alkylation repair protein [Candidatus Bathyarchaeota archaeon]